MSAPTPLPHGADHDLLLGVLALQLGFVGRDDLLDAVHEWGATRDRPLGHVLVDRQVLAPRRRVLLEDVIREYLQEHDMDASRGLAAACAACPAAISLHELAGTAAVRTQVGTLPSDAQTLPGNDAGVPPPPTVGSATSAGKRFRIVRLHARGALGEVYLAHDEELNREVALKQIQAPYANHADCRARFLLEAEITGGLEHPGIVPVYGLGTHPDGRPYYAMRFVRGESLHDAIGRFHQADVPGRHPSERALALRGLLARFLGVCHAVAYAHSKGVIHRDLKPSNVMLGPYGETLVVDWGLAKAFDRPVTTDSTELPLHPLASASSPGTMLGMVVGTPSFMAPEQAEGRVDQVGPRSDVYSLGATLYHLLTGVLPFPGDDADTVLRQVAAGHFPPPRAHKPGTPAALEAVALKAMAARPEDRYASVHELALDVERWLADERVWAYREPLADRAGRWMRRNRSFVSGLTALVLTCFVALGLILWLVRRERDVARANLALAQKAVDECFLVATEDPLLQQENMRGVRRLLLQKALPFYQGFRASQPDDPGIQQELALNHYRVAVITAKVESKPKAVALYREAQALYDRLTRAHPSEVSFPVCRARIANDIGTLQSDLGEHEAALASYEEARRLLEEVVRRSPTTAEYQADLARVLTNLGKTYRDTGQLAEARQAYEEARRRLEELAEENGWQPRHLADLADNLTNLGNLHTQEGDRARARRAYRAARDILEKLVRRQPRLAAHRDALANTLTLLGSLLRELGEADEASRASDRARQLRAALVAEFPDVPGYQGALAHSWNATGALEQAAGKHPQAEASYREAERIQERLAAAHPEVTAHTVELAGTLVNLGNLFRDTKRGPAALDSYARVLALLRGLRDQPAAQEVLRRAHWGRAQLYGTAGEPRRAAEDWHEAARLGADLLRDWFRSQEALALARAGDHAGAVRLADEVRRQPHLDAEAVYELACAYAVAGGRAGRDPALAEAERERRSEEYARLALALLRQARDRGLFQDATRRAHLRADADLVPLGKRPDFVRFVLDVERTAGKVSPPR